MVVLKFVGQVRGTVTLTASFF